MKEGITILLDFIRRLCGLDKKQPLSAQKALNLSKYGRDITREKLIKEMIADVEDQILYKCQLHEYSLSISVKKANQDIIEDIRIHFNNLGFKSYYIGEKEIPDLKEHKYLFLIWEEK